MIKKRSKRNLCLVLVTAGALIWGSCAFSVAPTNEEDRLLILQLSAFPDRVSADDSTATVEVWASVKRGTKPIKDITVVFFASTIGTITSSSLTRDGLAVAILTAPGDGRPRRGEVVAQALTVRDTLDIDLILVEFQ